MSRHVILIPLLLLATCIPLISGACAPTEPIPLTDGLPVVIHRHDEPQQNYYFAFTPSATTAGNKPVVIAVTSYTDGTPELYVVASNPNSPNQPACPAKNSVGVTFPSDGLARFTTLGSPRNMYWITVYAPYSMKFSIVAKFDNRTIINEGYPQSGRALPSLVANNNYDWMEARVATPLTATKVRFYLLPIRGNAVFYVSTTNTQPTALTTNTRASTYSLVGQNEVIWDLTDGTLAQPVNGTFYIGVNGIQDCRFFMTVHQTSVNAFLVPGYPQRSALVPGQWHYYTTRIENPQCSLSIVVTSFTGDSDLYTSTTTRRPSNMNWTSFDRYSINGQRSNDSVVYTTTIRDNEYGIGVLGFTASSYSIVSIVNCVGENNTDIAYLIMGQPQEGALLTNQSMWYRVTVGEHKDLEISITVDNGDPDLYVSTVGPPSYSRRNESDRSSFQWWAENYGNDIVRIPHDLDGLSHDDPRYCPKEGQEFCDYYIQVFAYEGCVYSIVATQSAAITQLRNGIPVHEDLGQNEYEYFMIPMDVWGPALTVTVTDLGRGDPDLLIRVADGNAIIQPSMFPVLTNSSTYTWSARRSGSDTIVIPPDPSRVNVMYLISVHAYTSTSFSIVASFNRSISLSPGVPQGGTVTATNWAYYQYTTNDNNIDDETLSFVLTTTSGRADMYVWLNAQTGTAAYIRRFNQIPQRIDVNHTSALACHPENGPCRYVIGVQGYASTARYAVTVHTGANVQLINGQPTSDTLLNNQWAYYEIYVPFQNQTLDLSVVVTTISGDPDIYLTNATDGTRPSLDRSTYQWYSTRFGGDSIDIENVKSGTYVLGVLCLGNCSYTVLSLIQAETPDALSLTSLLDGQPQRAFIPRAHWRYFAYDHAFNASYYTAEVIYTLTADYGDPDLYVRFDGNFPNQTYYQARSLNAGTRSDIIHIDNPTPTRHIIGVYSFQTTAFTLVASVSTGNLSIPTQASDGESITVNSTRPSWRFYQIDNLQGQSLNVKLTPRTLGETPQIYTSTTLYPGPSNYLWQGGYLFTDKTYEVTVDTDDINFVAGTYYTAVYATSYDILFAFGDTRQLEDGVVVPSTVIAGTSQYFTFRTLNTTNQDVYVTADACVGRIGLYMSQAQSHPTSKDCLWCDVKPIIVKNGNFLSSNFYVSVYGTTDAIFEIHANNKNSFEQIPDINYKPGVSNMITTSSPNSTGIRLSFQPAHSRLNSDSLTYDIYYSTGHDDVELSTSCGAKRTTLASSFKYSTSNTDSSISVDVTGLVPSTTYQFTVLVTDELGISLTSVYTPTSKIQTPSSDPTTESSSMSLKWLLGLGVPLFILLAAFIIYLVIRNRRLTKELEIEMHDVPKGVLRRAVGRGAALEDDEKHARSKPYSNLLTDGDRSDAAPTSDDPDAYHPPDYTQQL